MSLWAIVVIAGLAVLVGSMVQGMIGLGVALIASPVIVLLEPSLMPGSMIICGAVLPVMTLIAEHDDIDWRGLAWALPWRFVGTAIGGWLVAVASATALGLAVGIMVLVASGMSLISWRPKPSPVALSVGALVSGVGGTATSIGGPPIALVYQNQHASVLRSTLALYFCVGNVVSLIALAMYGELGWPQIQAGLLLLPFAAAGFGGSVYLRRRLDPERVRALVLIVCSVSAAILIVRAVI